MTQPVRPASASDAPMTFTKLRRLRVLSQDSISCGYSRETNSLNSGASTYSSTLRQYSFPSCDKILSRSRAKFCLLSGVGIFLFGIPSVARLPVADRAARHHFLASNVVIGLQLCAFGGIYIAVAPLHVEYLFLRPDKFFRLAMAGQAPLHLKRVFLVNGRHGVDLSVTCRAANAFRDVNTVVEVDVLRQVVDPLPLDRLILSETRPDG